jgi:hypothetical protein
MIIGERSSLGWRTGPLTLNLHVHVPVVLPFLAVFLVQTGRKHVVLASCTTQKDSCNINDSFKWPQVSILDVRGPDKITKRGLDALAYTQAAHSTYIYVPSLLSNHIIPPFGPLTPYK